eukprot:scaffold77164_cov30-Tisochrysis_lutea.AAC.2
MSVLNPPSALVYFFARDWDAPASCDCPARRIEQVRCCLQDVMAYTHRAKRSFVAQLLTAPRSGCGRGRGRHALSYMPNAC